MGFTRAEQVFCESNPEKKYLGSGYMLYEPKIRNEKRARPGHVLRKLTNIGKFSYKFSLSAVYLYSRMVSFLESQGFCPVRYFPRIFFTFRVSNAFCPCDTLRSTLSRYDINCSGFFLQYPQRVQSVPPLAMLLWP